MKKKIVLASIVALSLALVVAVGVTVAYLFVKTDSVVNTFEPSNIEVTLTETTGTSYKMIPGTTLAKNPTVTVVNDIDCYVFIKVEKTNDPDKYLDYSIITGDTEWKALDGYGDVYYRVVGKDDAIKTFSILTNNQVTVKNSVTKEMMNALYNTDGSFKTASLPELTFTAYAVQSDNVADAAAAWNIAIGATNP